MRHGLEARGGEWPDKGGVAMTIAPTLPREVATESRELKRDQDETGDPL
jgi:hypothetical protein